MTETDATTAKRASNTLGRLVFLAIAAACFLFLYTRLNGAAAREGFPLLDYMTRVFANVRWLPWLLLMIVYSCFYLTIDTLVITRTLGWFIKPIPYRDILPIRASAYIVSLLSEQFGKGVMAYYLNRRYDVPGWEVASVMLFIMFGEIFYLLAWASVGYMVNRSSLPAIFGWMPVITLGAAVVFTLWVLYFRGAIFPGSQFREKKIFHAFRMATLKHYILFFLLRSMNKQLRKVAPGPRWRGQARDGRPGATAGGDPAPGQGASTKP